ncbi:transporter, partial [Apiospora phragmitis]
MKLSALLHEPPGYLIASMVCSFGGFLFGIDTGIIGPVTVMDDFKNYVGDQSPTIHGLIVSSILIPAALSSFFAGKVADALGRSRGIAIGSFVFGIGAALEAASVHIGMFVAGRIVEGIGEGLYLGTLVSNFRPFSAPFPLLLETEAQPPRRVHLRSLPTRHRGALTTAPQLLTTLGLVAGFFTCYGSANIPSSFSWRLPFLPARCLLTRLLGRGPALAARLTTLADPARIRGRGSGRGLGEARRGRGGPREDPRAATHGCPGQQCRYYSGRDRVYHADGHGPRYCKTSQHPRSTIQQEEEQVKDARSPRPRRPPPPAARRLPHGHATAERHRRRPVLRPLLFQQAGLDTTASAFLASGVSALVIFAVTIPATLCADRWGRRANTIAGGLGMTCTMFLMGSLYASNAVHAGHGPGRWVVIVCIYVFAVLYCVSWAVGIKVYAAEIQRPATRASATGIAHGSNWLSNFLVALVTPTLLARSSYGAYFLFGGCTLLTALVCWGFMPETRGRSLDDIDRAFREKKKNNKKGAQHASVSG